MSLPFQFATGTIAGSEHSGDGRTHIGQSNQDAVALLQTSQFTIGVVCDGCSTGNSERGEPSFNELGARIGALLVVRRLRERLSTKPDSTLDGQLFDELREELLNDLRSLARVLIGDLVEHPEEFRRFVTDHLLFTVVGVVMTVERTVIFSLGDGLYAINGRVVELRPKEQCGVYYLADALFSLPESERPKYSLTINESLATNEVESLLLATDGGVELAGKEHSLLPGQSEEVGPLSRLWTEEHFSQSPLDLTLWLRRVNSQVTRLDTTGDRATMRRSPPLLLDDIALLVGRRRGGGNPCLTEST